MGNKNFSLLFTFDKAGDIGIHECFYGAIYAGAYRYESEATL